MTYAPQRGGRFLLVATGIALVALACGQGRADDWPTHRHDLARSGVTREPLYEKLHVQWRHTSAHRPRPAWDEPGRELNRLAFDYAHNVTVADGLVYFGSSADHKVYAIDLNTGRQRWAFFTGGPVRFAPTIADGRVLVGSDDGWLYCLGAVDGTLHWRFRPGPRSEMVLGNEQMISRWPLRTGVGVHGDTVYVTAGMWPSEGVHVCALRGETGEVIWHNDTSGTSYVKQPHPGSYAITGVAPQGYLLAHEGQLFVPTGRSVPAAYDSRSGKLAYYRGAPTSWSNRWGGSWNMLADGKLFSWRSHIGPDIPVRLGEYAPDKNDGIVVFDATTGKELREVAGKLQVIVDRQTLYASGAGKVSAYPLAAWIKGTKGLKATWETPHGRAYTMILAGDKLVVGGVGTVTAMGAEKGKVLWQDKVAGQVRDLAAADGRLLAATTEGEIICYGPGQVAAAPTIRPRLAASPPDEDASDRPAAAMARRILDETGKRAGYCLVIGAGNGRLLHHLARQSQLRIWCVEADANKVAAAREALDAAGLYGLRVTVHHGTLGDPIYPRYFADLIVSGDATGRALAALPAAEVYRVLRPCGGCAYLPAEGFPGGRAQIARWLGEGKVPAGQIAASSGAVRVVRGTLLGAGDWTHQYATAAKPGASAETLARLPLRLLWFGGPGPQWLVTRHWGGPSPLCVAGRMFVIGENHLLAVDAYNGRPLWRRDLDGAAWYPVRNRGASAAADGESIYLVRGDACVRLDAATGRTAQTYKPPEALAGARTKAAAPPVWSYLAVDGDLVLGALGTTRESRCVFALDKDGRARWAYPAAGVVGNNGMALVDGRVFLIDAPNSAQIAQARRRGKKIPLTPALVALDAKTGRIVWQTNEGIADRYALWIGGGVIVATGSKGITAYDAATGRQLYTRSVRVSKFPVIVGRTIYVEPLAFDLRTGEPRQRTNPFTGEQTEWNFTRSYGCGAISAGQNLLMFRSGTLGFYDLAGDEGVFNFGGVRAGCFINVIAAAGLVLAPPADAACTCSYSFRTTVALAPAEPRSDWSIFYDALPETAVRRARFNLGAPGDRFDRTGAVWLAMPRPVTKSLRTGIEAPFRFTMHEGYGAYQLGGAGIDGTDRPWLYAGGLRGVQRAEIDLHVLDRGLPAWPVAGSARPTARASDPQDGPDRPIPLPGEASVTMRYDKEKLYVAYARPAAEEPDGKGRPWKARTRGDDGPIWQDDSFELYFSPVPEKPQPFATSCLHLGLAASGARYDALWKYAPLVWPVHDIPNVAGITVDGQADDWKDRGLKVRSLVGRHRGRYGQMRQAGDFDQALSVGWNDQGVLVLLKVTDNVPRESKNVSTLWKGDAFGILLTARIGSRECYHLAVSPGADPEFPKPRLRFYDYRKGQRAKLTGRVACTKTTDGYVAEVLLPWQNLRIKPKGGLQFGMQVFVSDEDGKGSDGLFEVAWHAGGHPKSNPNAFQPLRLADKPSGPVAFKRSGQPDRYGCLTAARPYPMPIKVTSLGAREEDPSYRGQWTGSVRADEKQFAAELAIPWKTLADAGLKSGPFMIDLTSRGPLRSPPQKGKVFRKLVLAPEEMFRPKKVSLRLHFVEPDNVKPGQRVFDVKVQGKVMIENLDVIAAAGGKNRVIVKELTGISATRTVVLEFVPKAETLTPSTAPIISAIELIAEPNGR